MQLWQCNRLSEEQRKEIRMLETACTQHDGQSRPLFLCADLNFDASMPCFFLCRRGGRLAGVLSIFAPEPGEAEISARVLPAYRRQGIFSHMLATACETLLSRFVRTLLLVCDCAAVDCKRFFARWPLQFHNAEYSMVFAPEKPRRALRPGTPCTIRPVERGDLMRLAAANDAIFGHSPRAYTLAHKFFHDPTVVGMLAEHTGEITGVCNARMEHTRAYIFGLGVQPHWRGRGCGRALLYHTLQAIARAGNATAIDLEVDTDNPSALALYTTSGFCVRSRTDYYASDAAALMRALFRGG